MADYNTPTDMSLQIHPSTTYQYPEQYTSGQANFVRFTPINAGAWGPGTDIIFRLQSSNEFIDIDRSYVKLTFQETGILAGNSIGSLSSQGGTSFINQVTDTLGGTQLPVYRQPNFYQSIENKTSTFDRQCNLTQTQNALLFGGIQAITTPGNVLYSNATGTNGSLLTGTAGSLNTVCIPVCSYLATCQKLIPLALINGGLEHRITLENYNTAFVSKPNGGYQVTVAELHAFMVKPSDAYLQQLKHEIDTGSSIKLPIQLKKWYQTTLAASSTNTLKLQTGFFNSLDSILVEHIAAANWNVAGTTDGGTAKDSFAGNSLVKNITNFNIVISGVRYPRTFDVVNDTGCQQMMILSAFSSRYPSLQIPTTNNSILFYSWCPNGEFAQGISTSDGYIELNLSYTTLPTAGDFLNCMFNYSGLIEVKESGSVVDLSY